MKEQFSGSCACGSVQYCFDGEPTDCCFCHCDICRKLTGSSAGAYGSVPQENFNWQKGEDSLRSFSPTTKTRRYFCCKCGTFLLTEHDAEPLFVFVSLGTLDTPLTAKPEYRQFTDSRPSWSICGGELPEYAGWPESE